MLTRLGAWCGVLAGLAIAVPGLIEAFTGETAPTSVVLGLSPAFAVPLLTVLHLRQATAAGTFGAVAYTVNAVGLGLFGGAAFTLNLALFFLDDAVAGELLRGPTMVALLGSALVFAAGAVLFGVSLLRAGVHPRVPAVAYLVALPVLAVAARLPDTRSPASCTSWPAGRWCGWRAPSRPVSRRRDRPKPVLGTASPPCRASSRWSP